MFRSSFVLIVLTLTLEMGLSTRVRQDDFASNSCGCGQTAGWVSQLEFQRAVGNLEKLCEEVRELSQAVARLEKDKVRVKYQC